MCSNICDLGLIEVENINAFEWKTKGKELGNWLHYHVLLQSDKSFIKYKDAKIFGYSIKLVRLKNQGEVMKTCSYICKYKQDEALDDKYQQEPSLTERLEAGVYCFYDST